MIKRYRVLFISLAIAFAAGAAAEEMVLDATAMDSLTAGEIPDRYGFAFGDARGEGTRVFTVTNTRSLAKGYQTSGAPEGVGVTYVNAYGMAYANSAGEDANFEAEVFTESVQPGPTAGPGTRLFHRKGRHSAYSSGFSVTVSGWVVDRHASATRNVYRGP